MKKTLVITLGLLLVASVCFAKDLKVGTVEVAGGATLAYSAMDADVDGGGSSDVNTTSVVLAGYYYFMDNLGAGPLFAYSKTEFDSDDTSSLLIGPQILYNYTLSDQASVFAEAALGLAMTEMGDEDFNGWFWKLGAGLKYFLTDYVSVNGSVAYVSQTLSNDVDLDLSGFTVGAGLSVYLLP